MIDFPYLQDIVQETETRILFLVADGLGGLPHPETGRSELETARTPNLDRLARESACGLTTPVLPGIAPGSGPGHLALFGYDPLKYVIGRGVLEALGMEIPLQQGDIAVRGNFCTVDAHGVITDRRAGRISTEESAPLVGLLDRIEVRGVQVRAYPAREHRFVLVLRGEGLDDRVSDTDPGRTGVPPLPARALAPEAVRTAEAVNAFVEEARKALAGREVANMVLLRGFSRLPHLPPFGETYRLNPCAIAGYPMYRGLARVLGMEVLKTGSLFAEEVATLRQHWGRYTFYFLHYKPTDTAGEDGNFEAKVRAIEALDAHLPDILALEPDVFVLAGDHSTPAVLGAHSWHPVPLLLRSRWTKGEGVERFTERECARGSLGRLPATSVMMLALAHAGKLVKYGP